MGRSIRKHKYFGPLTNSGEQVQASAWVTGDSQARTSYIIKQSASRRYLVKNTSSPNKQGVCKLVNTAPAAAGQMTIAVYPYGIGGSGAAATNSTTTGVMSKLNTAVVNAAGVGYASGEVLALSPLTGSVKTTEARITINTTKVVTATLTEGQGGSGYPINSTVLLTVVGGTGTAATVNATVNDSGVVTAISSIVSAGSYTVNPGTYVSNEVLSACSTSTTGTGSGCKIDLTMGVNTITVGTASQKYTTLPPTTGCPTIYPAGYTGFGSGCTLNLTFKVESVILSAAGSEYNASPTVAFSGGGAVATATLSNGTVSAVVVSTAGSYTTIPTVTFTTTGSDPEFARKITARKVVTFAGHTYKWKLQGNSIIATGATIESA